MEDIEILKMEIQENRAPYFENEEFQYYLDKNGGDIKKAAYEMLVIKSEDSTISVSGLSTGDTSKWFLRLAQKFKTFNSGILGD